MSFKPIDGKRDEFRKYLERTGVLEAVSKVFTKLLECPERPDNAIEFIRLNLGDTLQQTDTIESLRRELDNSRNEISQLKLTVEQLRAEKGLPAKTTTESVENSNAIADGSQNNNEATNNSSNNTFSSAGNSVTENSKGDNTESTTGAEITKNDVEQQASAEETTQLTNGNGGDGGGTNGDSTDLNNSSVGASPPASATVQPASSEKSSAQSDSEPNKASAEGN